jgi:predicted ChrR family anti-sigma factor
MSSMRLVVDLLKTADLESAAWESPWPGIERHDLYEREGSSSAALLRYAPGAKVPRHRHEGFEHIYILRGSQRDSRGRYEAGTFIVNEPGSEHELTSDDGCLVLVVWQRPIVFVKP